MRGANGFFEIVIHSFIHSLCWGRRRPNPNLEKLSHIYTLNNTPALVKAAHSTKTLVSYQTPTKIDMKQKSKA